MAVDIGVTVCDRTLTRVAVADQLVAMEANLRWREVGGWQITVGDGPAADALRERGSSIVIDVDGTVVASGPTRTAAWGPDGTLEVYGYDDGVWLDDRVALPDMSGPDTINAVKAYTGAAETVLLDVVADNVGPAAAAARQAIALMPAGQARGVSGTWKATGQPLSDLVREIAVQQGWGWQVIQNGSDRRFRLLVPADLTASVLLHDDLDALADWERTLGRPEASWVYAAGPEATGVREVVDGGDAEPWGRIERWQAARTATDIGELADERDATLAERGPIDTVTADPAPIEAFRFAVDYGLGDIVSLQAGGLRRQVTVVGVDLTATTVKPVLSEDGRTLRPLPSMRRLDRLERRAAKLETA